MINGVTFSSEPNPENVWRIDGGALPMIAEMHKHGIRLDVPFLRALDARIVTSQRELESEIPKHIGNAYQDSHNGTLTPFNVGSPDHVARLLFQHLKVQGDTPVPMTKSKKREAVDDEVLTMFAKEHPVIDVIRDWRELNKLHTTYSLPLQTMVDSDSRIHTRFNPTVAATGRLASRDPNLQNIPTRTKLGNEIRNAFIASPGRQLVSCDLSQIEMRWAAHRSKDPVMMAAFWNREDIHTRTTCNVFHLDYATITKLDESSAEYKYFKKFQRLPCKTVGFGVLYGQTAEGLQQSLAAEGVHWTLEECEDLIINKFFGVYTGLRDMLARDHATAFRYAMIWDDFGRVRLVPEAKSQHRWIREGGVRKAGNHPEQAGAQGNIKLAMAVLLSVCRELDVWPLLQVHDELIFDVPTGIAEEFAMIASSELANAVRLDVPVESSSDIAERWGELK